MFKYQPQAWGRKEMAHGTTLGARLYSGETSFDFIASRKRWYAVSTLLLVISLGTIVFQGLHLGIEFKGGSIYTVTKAGATHVNVPAVTNACCPGGGPNDR